MAETEEREPVTPDHASPKPAERADTIYGVVVGLLYVVAVGVQVFLIVDDLTHGALSDDLGVWWRHSTARWRHHRHLDAMVRADFPYVLWAAHEILDVEGKET